MAAPINGSGATSEVAIFSDSKTLTGSQSFTFINGVLHVPSVDVEVVLNTGQDVPQPMLKAVGTWHAERGGDVYGADVEMHAAGKQQAAVHGVYVSAWSEAWDAYGFDARVESGTDAIQMYGAQFTVIANNPDAAVTGIRVSLHGENSGAELRTGLEIKGVGGPNSAAIRTDGGDVVLGNLIQPGSGLRPVLVDTETGKLVVG